MCVRPTFVSEAVSLIIHGQVLAPCFWESIRPDEYLFPCFAEGIRPCTNTGPCFFRVYSSVVDECLPHVFERVFFRERILASSCFWEGGYSSDGRIRILARYFWEGIRPTTNNKGQISLAQTNPIVTRSQRNSIKYLVRIISIDEEQGISRVYICQGRGSWNKKVEISGQTGKRDTCRLRVIRERIQTGVLEDTCIRLQCRNHVPYVVDYIVGGQKKWYQFVLLIPCSFVFIRAWCASLYSCFLVFRVYPACGAGVWFLVAWTSCTPFCTKCQTCTRGGGSMHRPTSYGDYVVGREQNVMYAYS